MEDYLPLSALNQWSYCPRRCGLIHLECDFRDNHHTLAGVAQHQRVDVSGLSQRDDVRVELALSVWSDSLRVSGRCDAVEFYPNGQVRPVEYKLGKRKAWSNDDFQVAAQALCLEEMLKVEIQECAIFHKKSQRLRKIPLTPRLREATIETIQAVQALLAGMAVLPPPTELRHRCGECSMHSVCQPDLWRAARASADGDFR